MYLSFARPEMKQNLFHWILIFGKEHQETHNWDFVINIVGQSNIHKPIDQSDLRCCVIPCCKIPEKQLAGTFNMLQMGVMNNT